MGMPATSATLAALRHLQQSPPTAGAVPAEVRCELCALPLDERHEHLLALDTRRLACACTACALLFEARPAGAQPWRRLPRDGRYLPHLHLDPAEWASLAIPIQLAFISINTLTGAITAAYPSPAGAVAADIDAGTWAALARDHAELATLAGDVEALLIDRMSTPQACYIVPLDAAYRLVGLVRQAWSGLSGGPIVRRVVAAFTSELRHG